MKINGVPLVSVSVAGLILTGDEAVDEEESPFTADNGELELIVQEVKGWDALSTDRGGEAEFDSVPGITFTFGGLAIDPEGMVQAVSGAPIPGLFAAGELVSGLFYDDYPGATGLVSGAVFGRLAGTGAAGFARESGET